MRSQDQLVHSRARVAQRYAVFPLEGYPPSRVPAWGEAEVRVLAAPAIGAGFVEYLVDVKKDGGANVRADGRVETFVYVLGGAGGTIEIEGKRHELREGGYVLVPPTSGYQFKAGGATRLLVLRKVYEKAEGVEVFRPLVGKVGDVVGTVFAGDEGARLQLLIPDEWQYDLAMNIFTFEVGHSLPYVETHVMEHGLYFMQGKGLYYLDGTWMEVERDDFIWMGPFCPQSFYATGPVASKYLYYKNVNREIGL